MNKNKCKECKQDCHCDSSYIVITRGFGNISKKTIVCETCKCPDALNDEEKNNG